MLLSLVARILIETSRDKSSVTHHIDGLRTQGANRVFERLASQLFRNERNGHFAGAAVKARQKPRATACGQDKRQGLHLPAVHLLEFRFLFRVLTELLGTKSKRMPHAVTATHQRNCKQIELLRINMQSFYLC